jgi:GH25 family lysozyme M1 (1,4-beta-N-acetylmuramidase)
MTARETFLRARLAIWRTRRDRAAANLKRYEAEIAKKLDQIEALPWPAKLIDVSVHQGTVDFAKVKAAGYAGVYVKATEGEDFRDPNFLRNVRAARAAGLKVGAYHFLRPKVRNGGAPAEIVDFVDALRDAGLGKGDLIPCLDVESTALGPWATKEYARDAINALTVLVPGRPLFYTYPSFLGGTWPSDFNNIAKLWIAHYEVSTPKVVSPWPKYHIWQWTSSGSVPGVAGRCDVNKTPDLKALIAS